MSDIERMNAIYGGDEPDDDSGQVDADVMPDDDKPCQATDPKELEKQI